MRDGIRVSGANQNLRTTLPQLLQDGSCRCIVRDSEQGADAISLRCAIYLIAGCVDVDVHLTKEPADGTVGEIKHVARSTWIFHEVGDELNFGGRERADDKVLIPIEVEWLTA